MRRIAVATMTFIGACSKKSIFFTDALQATPSFPKHPRDHTMIDGGSKRVPSRIGYLDEYHYTHDNDATDSVSTMNAAKDIRFGRQSGVKRRVHAKVATNASSIRNRRLVSTDADLSSTSSIQDTPRRHRNSIKRRNKITPRSTGTAILPTYIGNARLKKVRNKPPSYPVSERLTFEDEKEIAASIRRFRAAMRTRDTLAEWMSKEVTRVGVSQHLEPSEFQWAAACSLTVEQLQNVMHKGQEARTKLITGNVGLVTMIARRYYSMLKHGGGGQSHGGGCASLKLDDLVQEGYMGIMEAAERFDPSKGFRFSTYATHWIRQRIVRCIAECSRMIRLPVHMHAKIRHMKKMHKEMEERIGRSPSLPELAHEMGIPLDKLHLYQHLSHAVLSLENPIDKNSADDKRTLGDRIACTELPTPDEDAMSEALRGEVHAMLDGLDAKERWVLTHRFGLDDGQPKTLRETAERLGLSTDSVRSSEAKAMNKLRQPRMNYRLKDYVGGVGEADISITMDEYHHSEMKRLNNDINMNEVVVNNARPSRPTPESIWSF
mmetsp:Transcript_19148/g.39176  ORF Transcript_19148/g.39176 Transcript_19148/m.39176 type:complete len:548 (-) Transcript_19148:70-1713(-)